MHTRPANHCVEITYSENRAIGSRHVFASLESADDYVAKAIEIEPPPSGGPYNKTDFSITWSDGHVFRGRADITSHDVGRPVLRETAIRTCRRTVAWYGEGSMGVTAARALAARETLARLESFPVDDEPTMPGGDD